MTFLSRMADLMILNILYLVCCLPVLTAGAATTALYSCAMNLDELDEQPVFRRFFKAFFADFGRSTALFGVWLALMMLVVLNLWFYLVLLRDLDGWFRILPMVPVAILLLVSSYLFPQQACFDNGFLQLLKNAVSLTIVHLPTTIMVTAINCVPVLLLLFKTDIFLYLLAVWTLFGFALIAYLNGYLLKKVFRRYEPRAQENLEAEQNI